MFDGHFTHISLQVVEKAIAEDVSLVKLPPHVTDLLQPLDVCCFGLLKRGWETLLNEWVSIWEIPPVNFRCQTRRYYTNGKQSTANLLALTSRETHT